MKLLRSSAPASFRSAAAYRTNRHHNDGPPVAQRVGEVATAAPMPRLRHRRDRPCGRRRPWVPAAPDAPLLPGSCGAQAPCTHGVMGPVRRRYPARWTGGPLRHAENRDVGCSRGCNPANDRRSPAPRAPGAHAPVCRLPGGRGPVARRGRGSDLTVDPGTHVVPIARENPEQGKGLSSSSLDRAPTANRLCPRGVDSAAIEITVRTPYPRGCGSPGGPVDSDLPLRALRWLAGLRTCSQGLLRSSPTLLGAVIGGASA